MRLYDSENAVLDRLVQGSVARVGPFGQGGFDTCSVMFLSADFDSGTTQDRTGAPGPFHRRWGKWAEIGTAHKPLRSLGALTALQGIGARGIVHMDFQDARVLGTEARPLPAPVLCYCRRPGARNVVLWPLPRYHDLGTQRFLGKTPPDMLTFDDKRDAVVWRGALSGRTRPTRPGGRNCMHLIAALETALTARDGAPILAELRKNLRFGMVFDRATAPDFDLGLTCDDRIAASLARHGVGYVVKPSRPMSWQRQFRYILSVRGNDTGSNFIPALDSNSVVLREEDGWELFYSAVIRPWEHYIPLAPLLTDLDEKLDWARANPAECKAIAARARALCALLGDARLRDLHLRAVHAHYADIARRA
ncbi:glycosyl transferase family 90 [Roseinatronobacter sp.]|uniref:glycosyl transferase family 90 n=1 Tax=Roseinatronobacter sp. TaxID=1945755 RepID=UPI0025EE1BC3|nr:glycosyl transferase family 90 [Roseibaca sp.]